MVNKGNGINKKYWAEGGAQTCEASRDTRPVTTLWQAEPRVSAVDLIFIGFWSGKSGNEVQALMRDWTNQGLFH